MKTRTTLLSLAALAALSLGALAPTSASASGWGRPGHGGGHWGGGHHWGGGRHWGGGMRHWGGGYRYHFGQRFIGNDYGRYSRTWPRYQVPAVNPCECEEPVQRTYVPIRVPVYVPVKVPVRVEVPVPVKVPVYVPVKTAEPCECEEPAPKQTYMPEPQQTAEPCDCEEPEYQGQPQSGPGRQYDQSRRQSTNYASRELEKK